MNTVSLMLEFGIRSPNGVTNHLLALKRKGFIEKTPQGIRLVGVKLQFVEAATC